MRVSGRILALIGVKLLLSFIFTSTTMAQLSAQTWSPLFPTGTPPVPRYDAGSAYDEFNDRLILFSGEDFTGLPRPTDVWVLTDASGTSGTSHWLQLAPSGAVPLGREGGTKVYDITSNSLIIHGGCSANCSPALSDAWVLSNANGLGGTPTWTPLPSAPIARTSHTAVYDSNSHRMIIFGGNQAFFNTNRNDVWVLTNANGVGSPTWIQLFPTGTPPTPREGTAGIYDQVTNQMIIFGGVQYTSSTAFTYFNDVWVLTHANGLGGTPQWIQLSPSGTPPTARAYYPLAYDYSSSQIYVFSGYNGSLLNDLWVLANANSLNGPPEWLQLTPTGGMPTARFGHSAAYSTISNRLLVAMGRNDQVSPPLFNDVWVFSTANTAPTAVAGGPYLVKVGDQITLNGSASSDPNGDPLTELWTADGGTVAENLYTAGSIPGVYDVQLIVNDGQVDSQPSSTFVVIYDPNGGFVTGGGWILSPDTACPIFCNGATGRANFGFVAKYKKGQSIPDGNTQFQFQAGAFNFQSLQYEWLVIAGANAKFKGVGTINGSGNFGFMLTGTDSGIKGDGSSDTFRIKIWDKDGGDVVIYDNQMGASDDSYAGTVLEGGSIIIHSDQGKLGSVTATSDTQVTDAQQHRVLLPLVSAE